MNTYLKHSTIALILAGLAPFTAQAVNAPISEDTYASSAAKGKPKGKAATLLINSSTKGFLKFNLSALPAGVVASNVSKAILFFYVQKPKPAAFDLGVRKINTPWTEESLISSAAVTYDTNLPIASSGVNYDGLSYTTVDITSIVKDWVEDPDTNFGLALENATPISTKQFVFLDSKESKTTGHPAFVEITLEGGIAGDTGAAGPTGASGPVGETGAAGATGVNGNPGGATGATGAAGTPGAQGATGDIGAVGPTGALGLSTASTWTAPQTWEALGTFLAGLSSSGADISLNVDSNFPTHINTGGATGSVNIGGSENTTNLNSRTTTIGIPSTLAGSGVRIANGRFTVNKPVGPVSLDNGNVTATVSEILDSGIFTLTQNQIRSITLPTAQGPFGLVQALPGSAVVGDVFTFQVSNASGGSITLDPGAGTGNTLIGNGTINAGEQRVVYCRVSSVTSGAESLRIY